MLLLLVLQELRWELRKKFNARNPVLRPARDIHAHPFLEWVILTAYTGNGLTNFIWKKIKNYMALNQESSIDIKSPTYNFHKFLRVSHNLVFRGS